MQQHKQKLNESKKQKLQNPNLMMSEFARAEKNSKQIKQSASKSNERDQLGKQNIQEDQSSSSSSEQQETPQSMQFELNMIEEQPFSFGYNHKEQAQSKSNNLTPKKQKKYNLQEIQKPKQQQNKSAQNFNISNVNENKIKQQNDQINVHSTNQATDIDNAQTNHKNQQLFMQFADNWRQAEHPSNRSSNSNKQQTENLTNPTNLTNQSSIQKKLNQNNLELQNVNQQTQDLSNHPQSPIIKIGSVQSQKQVKPFVTLTQFQSQKMLYQQFQHDEKVLSSDSQGSVDSEASFAKMNARRTMLLSDDFYGLNQYTTIINQLTTQQCKIVHQCSKKIAHLQSLLKRQSLLLEFEEKTKNERIKQIEYSYFNAFNNFLFLRNVKNSYRGLESNPILLNPKDLYQIHEQFLDDLRRIKEAMSEIIFSQQSNEQLSFKRTIQNSLITQKKQNQNLLNIKVFINNELPPPQIFLIDFNNFFPCWYQNVYLLMEHEFQTHEKIQNTFQSQYTLPSKVLSSIKYKDNIYRFCQIIFRKPLQELRKVKSELVVDFSSIYEKWSSILFNIPNSNPLKQFLEGKYLLQENSIKNSIVQEISKFFGQKMEVSQYEKLLIELNHFARNRNAMNFLFNQVGREEIESEAINLRLALLVYKKMQINRRKLQQLALMFINQIIDSYEQIPIQIKYVMQVFKRLAKKKLESQGLPGVLKFEDIKSFFNKIIFSQLFFSTFMQLHDQQNFQMLNNKKQTSYYSHNITMIALIAQKIMFGQQFYEKFKYGYFNSIIKDYTHKIKTFIENFAEKETIVFEKRKQVQYMLVSLETVKFMYQVLKKKGLIKQLQSFQKKLMNIKKHQPFSLGSSKYTQQKMYIMIGYKPQFSYSSIFKPKQKFRKTFIQFLMLIQSINDGITFREVLQQYKYMEQDNLQISKPSIQIYANYLSSFQKKIQNQGIVEQIEQIISKTKNYVEKIKISLEKQHNVSINLQNLYKNVLISKKKSLSKDMLEDYINLLYNLPLQFDYCVIDNKICQNQSVSSTKKKQRIIKDCLNDIAQYFGKNYQGLDGLYSLLLQKIVAEVQKHGVMDENMIQSAQNIIGERLFKMINLSNIQTDKDKKLFNSMKRHRFLNLKMLALSQYIDEQQIILELSLEILEKLKHPMSPDKMTECFNQVTIVFQNVITCVGKASDITSDVQIPLMELILIKSMIPNLNSILQFIKIFSHNDSGSNKFGMILALVESICYLIENMDAQHLGISEAEYMGYIENEYIIVD